MNLKWKLWIVGIVSVTAFVVGYGAMANAAYPSYGDGYFDNHHDNDIGGRFVWSNLESTAHNCESKDGKAIPDWVVADYAGNYSRMEKADRLIKFVFCKLDSTTTHGSASGQGEASSALVKQNKTGAAFIISLVIGKKTRNPSSADRTEFRNRIERAASQGRIQYINSIACWQEYDSNGKVVNTYYDDGHNDIATAGDCGNTGAAIVVTNTDGTLFILKRVCANTVGDMHSLDDFTITGLSSITNSTSAARGSSPLPGDTIMFHHSVTNEGHTSTGGTAIWSIVMNMPHEDPNSKDGVGVAGPDGTTVGSLAAGQTKGNLFSGDADLTVKIPATAAPGTKYCQRLGWDPIDSAGHRNGRSKTVCATVVSGASVSPQIIVTDNGQPLGEGGFVEPGNEIKFQYAVMNDTSAASSSVACVYRQSSTDGYSNAAPTATYSPSTSGAALPCPPNRVFPAKSGSKNTHTTASEIVSSAPAGKSLCRSMVITPAKPDGSSATATVCVHVVTKPYASVRGGDVSVGAGVMTADGTCSTDQAASIIGWNRGGSPNSFQGAGVQFAAYALGKIYGTATSSGNGPGAAPAPAGLSFANTGTNVVNVAGGVFGGMFGAVPCTRDYYAEASSADDQHDMSSPSVSVGNLASGVYHWTGRLQIDASTIPAGRDITIYVDDHAYITGDIGYGGDGTWTSSTIPSFRLIVKGGNIYISNAVHRLDGLYVAQTDDDDPTHNGVILTCAPVAYTIPDVQKLPSLCGSGLTVNGGFVARQVWLLRAIGTLGDASPNPAEVFSYNPMLWIAQPPSSSLRATQYDAITSLPPVL